MRKLGLLLVVPLFTLACYGFSLPGMGGKDHHDRGDDSEAPPPPAAEESEPTFTSYHVIDSVEVLVLESAPPQLQVLVNGYQPDGCEYPVFVDQRREGNDIYIEIYRDMPLAAACPAMIVDYQASIQIDGTVESGQTYTVHVNDVTQDVTP